MAYNIFATNTPEDIMEKYYCELHSFLDGDENCPDCKSGRVELPVKPESGGQIYLLYKRLLGYSDMTPILVEIFADVEKALDKKYKLQKDDHANSYFIEDSRLSV
jgi:hypothetical protein